ncbi:putative transmembrane protein [Senna tora]|uniref:Putative transmembrane protein n=1 Tax=Senna tora TaxID=362788 RepID=A0A834TL09_9FABA|nr:putative transmembrane protein [Senna tora]
MKNVSKNTNVSKNNKYFSSCFRPVVVDIDAMLDSTSTSTSTSTLPNKAGHSVMHHHPPKRNLSLLIKALVFPSILNRRGRRNKSKLSYLGNEGTKPEPPLSGGSSPVPASSSSSESQCSEWKPKEKVMSKKKEKRINWLGIEVVVISLTFTVLCEKYWGIVLTSTCMYLLSVLKGRPRSRRVIRSGGSIVKSREE